MSKINIDSETRPKNICLITENTENLVVLSIAKSLSKLNCKVSIIALNHSNCNLQTKDYNFNIHIIKNNKVCPLTEKTGRITKYLQSINNAKHLKNKITEIGIDFDLIVSNMYLANIACKKLNMPNTHYCIHSVISSVIANYYNDNSGLLRLAKKQLYLLLVRRLYKDQNLIVVSNGIGQDLIRLGIQPKNIQTIYNPIDFPYIKKQSKEYSVKEKDYIVHVGRFSKEKRHDVLINAYIQSGVKQKLLLLGDHHNDIGREIKQLVQNLNLQEKIIFKGFKSNPFPYIKNAKALTLSSDHEGFGMVLVEALALKTPVISTACIGPNEILCGELKSFLSPTGDANALAKNIKKMIDNPIKITEIYTNKFSAEKSAKQYLDLCS